MGWGIKKRVEKGGCSQRREGEEELREQLAKKKEKDSINNDDLKN